MQFHDRDAGPRSNPAGQGSRRKMGVLSKVQGGGRMTRKEFIEYLEELRLKSINRMGELVLTDDVASINYQLGKSVAYRTAIEKLEEKKESEVGE
jgi:hypothetical protein